MTIVPETRAGKIEFYRAHVPVWADDPGSIGVTSSAVATVSDLLAEAQEAYQAHRAARLAARSATQKFHDKVRDLHAGLGGGASLIQSIKTFAQVTGDNGVYVRARIDPPSKPGRRGSSPPPGKPWGFEVALLSTGAIELTWKCDNPANTVGTLYQIRRQLNNEGAYVVIGTVGAEKSFVDESLPAGVRCCTYEVRALRSTRKGQLARYTVYIGGSARRTPGTFQAAA